MVEQSVLTRPQPPAARAAEAPATVAPPAFAAQPPAEPPADAPLLWTALVTDGHVRAARLRRVQPWVIAAGVVLLWLGFWIASRAPDVKTGLSAQHTVQERISKMQQRADAALGALATVPAAAAPQLPPLAELSGVVQQTLAELDKSGELPKPIDFVKTDRNAIWKGDWSAERIHFARDGDVLLVAATVNAGPPQRMQPVRWIGAFKKFGARWQYASLGGAGLYGPREYPVVRPSQIALSLAPLLPDER